MKNIPLYQQIEDTFTSQIKNGLLKQGDRIPSEAEIVDSFHVSQITAKRALNNLASDGYADRIQGKGTFVTAMGIEKKTFLIGILFTTLATDVDKELLNQLEHCARKNQMRLLFGLSRESTDQENETIAEFLNSGVDGIVIFPTVSETYNNTIIKLFLDRFPLVLIDRYFKKIDIPSVTSNNYEGGYKLTELMIERGLHKLCFISTQEENSATLDRQQGIEAAFVDKGLPTNKNDWLFVPSDTQDKNAITQFLEEKRPDCVITVNAHLARMASEYTLKHDVQHLTFDSARECDYYVHQNPAGIADMTLYLMKKLVTGKPIESHSIRAPITLNPGDRRH
jgi:DNA-binding LacI/PurR family transcriptional regulator